MGGSMGAVVGEKVTRAAEHALEARMPLIIVSASGGARMQEGTLALMQLAKTLAASSGCARPACRSSASCPTRRPAACSRRSPRSATSTSPSRTRSSGSPARGSPRARSRRSCRTGFQRAEFLFSHGFIDRVVARPDLRDELAHLLRLLPAHAVPGRRAPEPATEDLPGFRPLSFLSSLAGARRREPAPDDGVAAAGVAGR